MINPAIKNKFFNYLDIYANGMIVLDTFLSRLKLYKSDIIIFENNNRKYYIKYETIKKN